MNFDLLDSIYTTYIYSMLSLLTLYSLLQLNWWFIHIYIYILDHIEYYFDTTVVGGSFLVNTSGFINT